MMTYRIPLSLTFLLAGATALGCGSGPREATSATTENTARTLTIYSSPDSSGFDGSALLTAGGYESHTPGFGIVREVRPVQLSRGTTPLAVTDIAARIDPTTVTFRSRSDSTAAVVEQNFEYDLASADLLLQRYLGKRIVLTIADGENKTRDIEGTLIAPPSRIGYTTSYVIRDDARSSPLILIEQTAIRAIRLGSPSDAETLLIKPTLKWLIRTDKPGPHDVEIAYETAGLTWRADYALLLSPDEKTAELSAWVSILNLSGMSYRDTRLKLIAGEVNRSERRPPIGQNSIFGSTTGRANEDIEQKPFGDYHLYTLQRPTTLPDRSYKQIELFAARKGVKLEKRYLWTGPSTDARNADGVNTERGSDSDAGKIHVILQIKNAEAAGLGLPMPKGLVRVSKVDPADGSREFLGEDNIDHTPRDEPIQIRLGEAFDVAGSRVQSQFDLDGRSLTETYTVSIRNRKDSAVKVTVREPTNRWKNWTVTKTDAPWKPINMRYIEFELDLPPGTEKTVTYTIQYKW